MVSPGLARQGMAGQGTAVKVSPVKVGRVDVRFGMAVRVCKGLVGLLGSGTAWQLGRGRFGFGQACYGSAVKVS